MNISYRGGFNSNTDISRSDCCAGYVHNSEIDLGKKLKENAEAIEIQGSTEYNNLFYWDFYTAPLDLTPQPSVSPPISVIKGSTIRTSPTNTLSTISSAHEENISSSHPNLNQTTDLYDIVSQNFWFNVIGILLTVISVVTIISACIFIASNLRFFKRSEPPRAENGSLTGNDKFLSQTEHTYEGRGCTRSKTHRSMV